MSQALKLESQIIEDRHSRDLIDDCYEFDSLSVKRAYINEIPNIKISTSNFTTSKLDRFREAGLIGCLNDTGLTSKNYKNELYKK